MSKIFAANWKMNPSSLHDALELFDTYLALDSSADIWVFPPALYTFPLISKSAENQNKSIRLGVQSISDNEKGAFTGQISAEMVKNLGLNLVLIGHSEARKHQVNAVISCKFLLAVQNHLTPVVCLGYQHQYESFEKHNQRVLEQIQEVLDTIIENNLSINTLYLAYEPIWAIGTGKVADEESITQVFDLILDSCKDLKIPVKLLYGGSVDETNIQELSAIPNLAGFLVGGAALKPDKLTAMIKKLNK
jgi:triosephosphate isomerase (TIM)